MALKKKELVRELEHVIKRLEQARSDTLKIHDSSDARFQSLDAFAEVSVEIDGIEAALLVAESRIDELTQVLSEEIDNLTGLLEKIEEDFD